MVRRVPSPYGFAYCSRFGHQSYLIIGCNSAALNLPRAGIVLDVSPFCRLIAGDSEEIDMSDELGVCDAPTSAKNKLPPLIKDEWKEILMLVQLCIIKSTGVIIKLFRASGLVAKKAAGLIEIFDTSTPLNFFSSSSVLINALVPECRFVFTNHISSLLRQYPIVCLFQL